MADEIVTKIRTKIRIGHNKLDGDVRDEINACIADLKMCGIIDPVETDPLIYNAITLWCKRAFTEDVEKSQEFGERYDGLKACLQMAEGYGWKEDSNE